ncbi:hypothetical protein BCR33DRAFT_857718 [Rhizoclosmatium globosum]|uniref:C2H2-type domain-containing protein n=1 Tax=Rhizoclosmatium globosum TaxID=329046 RepID=A0A1Y2B4Q2_9FUNG|nr:hypothetical protein BCR33DRAFT_857718 [Rhizoclosmatium globosum]|eukprot:ORY29457.1 hypothetical protein BCR33DRAFT_857718 [Rhizoclosmatium globosum]
MYNQSDNYNTASDASTMFGSPISNFELQCCFEPQLCLAPNPWLNVSINYASILPDPFSSDVMDLLSLPPTVFNAEPWFLPTLPTQLLPETIDQQQRPPSPSSPTPSSRPSLDTVRCPCCKTTFTGSTRRQLLINHCESICYWLEFSKVAASDTHIQCPVDGCTRAVGLSNWRTNMADHMQIHDETRVRGFQCDGCGKVFRRKNLAKDCMTVHEGGVFPCSRCPSVFKKRYEREKHRKTHL